MSEIFVAFISLTVITSLQFILQSYCLDRIEKKIDSLLKENDKKHET